jgi:hypothetical protein
MKLRSLTICLLALCASLPEAGATGPTVNISGGGTGVLSAAITANTTTGATLFIQDSGTYTESGNLFLGPRRSATLGRRSFDIQVAPGQNPTIVPNGGIIMYSGAADLNIGSNTGGRLNIDARNSAIGGTSGAIWYIGQEDGLSSGQACQAKFENVTFDFRDRLEGIVFGAGGNDGSPNTTSASLTLDNVRTIGGGAVLQTLYPPANYASTVTVTDSQFMDVESHANNGSAIVHGAFQLGGVNSILNVSRSIFYAPATTQGPLESTLFLVVLGQTFIDHSDIISLASTTATPVPVQAARAVTEIEGGEITITNSIVRGEVGVAAFGTGNFTVTDSNVSATDVENAGFTFTNVISEWPVFDILSSDPSDPAFIVKGATASATHGSSPPIGAKTTTSSITPARHWSLY